MAIPIINSAGTTLYVAEVPDEPWETCLETLGAITNSKMVGCPQAMGPIVETRGVRRYKCISTDYHKSILGSVTRDSIMITLLLDVNDVAGQKALKDNFKANSQFILGIELPKNTWLYWFHAKVSKVATGIVMNEAVTYKVTVELMGEITTCVNERPNACITYGDDSTWVGFEKGVFGSFNPEYTVGGVTIYSFKWNAAGNFIISWGDLGNDKILNVDRILVFNEARTLSAFAVWNEITTDYEFDDLAIATELNDGYYNNGAIGSCFFMLEIPRKIIDLDLSELKRGTKV